MAAMAPALTETTTEGHGFQLSSSLPSSSIEPDTFMHKDDTSAEQKLNGNCDTQATWSQLAYPCAAHGQDASDLKNKPYGSTVMHSSIPNNTALLTSVNSLLDRLSLNLNLSGKKSFSKDSPNIVTKTNLFCDRTTQTCGFNTSKIYAEPEAKLNSNKNSIKGLSCKKNSPLKCMSMLTDAGGINMACVSASVNLNTPSDIASSQKAELKPNEVNGIQNIVPAENTMHAENVPDCSRELIQLRKEKQLSSSTNIQKTEKNAELLVCLDRQQKLAKKASRLRKRLQIIQAKHIAHHIKQRMQQLRDSEPQRQQALSKLDGSKTKLAHLDGRKHKDGVQIGLVPNPVISELCKYTYFSKALLSHVEGNMDSDATDSSTDEDSDMEQISLRKNISVKHRSEWGWAMDRGKISSRWTWLQAYISDLEYRIQHMSDIHRQIRSTKEMVILDDSQPSKGILKQQLQLIEATVLLVATEDNKTPAEMMYSTLHCNLEMSPSSPSLLLRNIDKQSAQLTESVNSLIPPLNLSPASSPVSCKPRNSLEVPVYSILGGDDPNSSNSSGSEKKQLEKTEQELLSTTDTSARVRQLRTHNKRKLFFSVHNANRELQSAAVQYQSSLPVCCNKCDVVDQRTLMREDQIALLDPSFHPVLSLHCDVPLGVHFQTLLNGEEWDNQPFPPVMNNLKASSANSALCKRHTCEGILDSVGCNVNKEYCAKVRGQHWNQSFNPELHTRTEASRKPLKEIRKRKHSNEKTAVVNKRHCALLNSGEPPGSLVKVTQTPGLIQGPQCSSPTDSWVSRSTPSQRALPQTKDIPLRQRHQSECCYDIDNIVVPMSLVATSKIEKLQYKEIITPSWRTMAFQPLKELYMKENELEDTSDKAFSLRHKKHEVREQARWLLWEQSRCHRRSNRLPSFIKNNDAHLNPRFQPPPNSEKPSCSMRWCSELAQNKETQVLLMEGELDTKVVLPWNCHTFPLSEEDIKHSNHPEEVVDEKGSLRPLTRLYAALSENGRAASERVPSAGETECKLSIWGQNRAKQ